jgi:RHS repeat-associated protein
MNNLFDIIHDSSFNLIDWSKGAMLMDKEFVVETSYNALNLPVTLTQSDGTELYYGYDKGGLLNFVQRNDTEIPISDITYNEKQQRLNIYYGNNTVTKYEYNPLNFRLMRILITANAMQNYTQYYRYDELGNILQLQSDSNQSRWIRDYIYDIATNRLLRHSGTTDEYWYDQHGNIISMPHLHFLRWDYKDQFYNTSNGTYSSFYRYDAQGNRTRKVIDKDNIIETRYYLDGFELYRREVNGAIDYERTTLNISDDEKVFVRVEKKTNEPEIVRYQYDNHLGSACLELDYTGRIISYEEYHPFGTTSYRSGRSETEVSLKRYKYCGKERDEQTGFYYYGMRYYAGWLCRFVSVDPMQFEYPELTPYQYASNRPITMIDLDGGEAERPKQQAPPNETDGGLSDGTGSQSKPIQLQLVEISVKGKVRESFEKYPDVLPSTGWSILNQGHEDIFQVGYAHSFQETIMYSLWDYDVVYLEGDILKKIIGDEDMQQKEKEVINDIKTNTMYGKQDFYLTGEKKVAFGGKRWSDKEESWFALPQKNPFFYSATWKVGANELTWTLRNTTVKYWAEVTAEGNYTIEYRLYDVLDLEPHNTKESKDYDTVVSVLGPIYHEGLGGNRNLQTRAQWEIRK